jgi:hypothetical protein
MELRLTNLIQWEIISAWLWIGSWGAGIASVRSNGNPRLLAQAATLIICTLELWEAIDQDPRNSSHWQWQREKTWKIKGTELVLPHIILSPSLRHSQAYYIAYCRDNLHRATQRASHALRLSKTRGMKHSTPVPSMTIAKDTIVLGSLVPSYFLHDFRGIFQACGKGSYDISHPPLTTLYPAAMLACLQDSSPPLRHAKQK